MVSAKAGWIACIAALTLSASSPMVPVRATVGPPAPDSDAKVVWGMVSHAMTELVFVLPGWWNADVLIALFKTHSLNPKNRALIVRAVGAAYRPDYALIPPVPAQSAAERSVSAEFGLPDGRVSMEMPNAYVTRRNARIVSFLMSAADDPDDGIAITAVLSYSAFAEAKDAMRLVRHAFRRGVLPTESFLREAFAHLPNLDDVEQEVLINALISADRSAPERGENLSLRIFLSGFFGFDHQGMESISPGGRAALQRYVDTTSP